MVVQKYCLEVHKSEKTMSFNPRILSPLGMKINTHLDLSLTIDFSIIGVGVS
jgi:hypothetical protein